MAEPGARARVENLIRSGALEQAEALLRDMMAQEPVSRWARARLAHVLTRRGRFPEAEGLVTELLSDQPDDPVALTLAGDLYARRSQGEEAESCLRAALAAPGGGRTAEYAAFRLATLLVRQRRGQEALGLIQQLLERHPQSRWLRLGLATVQEHLGAREQAAAVYRQILAQNPRDEYAYARLVRLEASSKDPSEAAQELQRMLRMGTRAENPKLHLAQGDQLYRSGDVAGAAVAYERALALGAGDTYVRMRLGQCLTRLGRHSEACDVLVQATVAAPQDFYCRNVLAAAARAGGLQAQVADRLAALIQGHPERRPLWGLVRRLAREARAAPEEGDS